MSKLDVALAQLVHAGIMAEAMPGFEVILDDLELSARNRVFTLLNKGEVVSPECATAAWQELYAYNRVRTRLTRVVKQGQSAGVALTPYMDGDNGE